MLHALAEFYRFLRRSCAAYGAARRGVIVAVTIGCGGVIILQTLLGHASLAASPNQAVSGGGLTPQDQKLLNAQVASSPYAAFLLSNEALRRSDFALARQFLVAGLAAFPDNPQLQSQALLVFIAAGDFERGVQAAKTYPEDEAGSILASFVLVNQSLKQNDLVAAAQFLSRIKEKDAGDSLSPILLAHLAAADPAKPLAAAKIYGLLSAVKSNPNYAVFYQYHLLLLAEQLGDDRQAAAAFAALSEYTTQKSGLAVSLARAMGRYLEGAGKFDQAANLYREASQNVSEPKILSDDLARRHAKPLPPPSLAELFAQTYLDAASLAGRDGDEGRVTSFLMLRLAEQIFPDRNEYKIYLAEAFNGLQQPQAAFDLYTQTVSDPIWGWHSRLNRAILRDRLGDKATARQELVALGRERSDRYEAYQHLGDFASRDEQYDDAIMYYSKALAQTPDHTPQRWYLLYLRAGVYEAVEKYNLIEADLQAALKIAPNQPQLMNFLGYMWADRGINLDQALVLLTEAHAALPNDAAITDSIGWVHYRRGNYAQAVNLLESAVLMRASDPMINDHLGDAYWRIGRKREAVYQWQQALTLDPEAKYIPGIEAKIRNGLPQAQ
ncbi:MAG: tetratricopeptide repeat protein [Candidatus Symbiobacter sp.]|nr:tetratricopeptide repeat protein [Candidatus Symbiobacter sp.]